MTAAAPRSGGPFVCPGCRGALEPAAEAFACAPCGRTFPVVLGIADFRLRPDRYLSLEDEREKARRLAERGRTATFEELLSYYYEITDDVPPELARRYAAYVRNGPAQAADVLEELLSGDRDARLVDLGCGAGGMLVAASGRARSVVGVDIALRWLVICRKRLEELGIEATLVCADAEALPFADGAFTHAAAVDLLEHVRDPRAALSEMRRVLADGGAGWLSAANRYCVGPHPTTRVLAIGYLPAGMRSWLLRRLRGTDSLRHTRLVSPGAVRRLARDAGLAVERTRPRPPPRDRSGYPAADRLMMSAYAAGLRVPPARWLAVALGPVFEMKVRARASAGARGGSR